LTVRRNSENLLCACIGADLKSKTELRVFATIVFCACVLYGVAAFRQLHAALAASAGDLPGLETAVRLEPDSAEYQNALGRMYAFTLGRPSDALDHLQLATALNPHRSRYWIDVAAAGRILGPPEKCREWLRNAVAADPTNPAVAWEAANISVANGDVAQALTFLHAVAEHDESRRARAIELALRVNPDDEFVMRGVVPPSSEAYLDTLRILVSEQRADAAQRTWEKIVELHQPINPNDMFTYLQFLLDRRQSASAWSAWTDLLKLSPSLHPYKRDQRNVIVNSGFELPLLNAAFEWRAANATNGALLRDTGEHHSGKYSLLATYDTGRSDGGRIEQLVLVLPDKTYRFSAYMKCEDLEGALGPNFRIVDYYVPSRDLFHSSECRGTQPWHEVAGSFTTPTETQLLRVELQRDSQQLIRGRAWVDDISLEAR
jgi:tetratricopeptide (TPR) repeat protein